MTSHDHYQAPGVDECHGCGKRVLFALAADDVVLALDPDERGVIAAWQDGDGIARCRRVSVSGQLALGEFLFRFHDATCTAIARPRPIGTAPSARRPARPDAPRRAAR